MHACLATVPASPDRENEDFVAATARGAVLLDGAGTPAGSDSGCVHGVSWYVRQLGAALLIDLARDAADLTGCLRSAVAQVRDMHDGRCDLSHPGSPSATVVLVRRSGPALDYLVLADSALVIDRPAHDPLVITDDREARIGRDLRTCMDTLDAGTREHADARREYIEALRGRRNRPGGFWVASVDPDAADEALTGSVPLTDVQAAALLSDGASRLVDRFNLATWPAALKILATDGPAELIRRVREAEASDPHGNRWPRGKTYDDASVAYLTRWGDT